MGRAALAKMAQRVWKGRNRRRRMLVRMVESKMKSAAAVIAARWKEVKSKEITALKSAIAQKAGTPGEAEVGMEETEEGIARGPGPGRDLEMGVGTAAIPETEGQGETAEIFIRWIITTIVVNGTVESLEKG